MTKNDDMAVAIVDRRMSKEISDLLSTVPSEKDMTPSQAEAYKALRGQMAEFGSTASIMKMSATLLAVILKNIQDGKHWEKCGLKNPDTGKGYSWAQFRVKLSDILNLGTGTIGWYLKVRKFAGDVLEMDDDEFLKRVGMETVPRAMEVCDEGSLDGRALRGGGSYADVAKPANDNVTKALSKYGGDTFQQNLTQFYYEQIAEDIGDSSENPKSTGERRAIVDQVRNDPSVWFERLTELNNGDRRALADALISYARSLREGEVDPVGLKWWMRYPNREEGDETVVGETDFGFMVLHEWVPLAVVDELEDRLRVK